MAELNYSQIEAKWQKAWQKKKIEVSRVKKGQKKFYLIFAYPGASGFLHVGHMRGFSYADIITRYKRLQGYNVLFPAGVHGSGIIAETLLPLLSKKNNFSFIVIYNRSIK